MRRLAAIVLTLCTHHAFAADACWELAASEAGATVALMQAIAWTESSMRAHAVNTSHQHITGTRDIGLVQVNSEPRMLQRLGVTEAGLFEPCTNLRAGARILKEKFARYGMTWEAVGAYNASCTRLKGAPCQAARMAYAWRVHRALQVQHGAAPPLRTARGGQSGPGGDPAFAFVSLR